MYMARNVADKVHKQRMVVWQGSTHNIWASYCMYIEAKPNYKLLYTITCKHAPALYHICRCYYTPVCAIKTIIARAGVYIFISFKIMLRLCRSMKDVSKIEPESIARGRGFDKSQVTWHNQYNYFLLVPNIHEHVELAATVISKHFSCVSLLNDDIQHCCEYSGSFALLVRAK